MRDTLKFSFLLFLFLALPAVIMSGQDNFSVFEHFSVSDGLSNSVINDIIQDQYGLIWIATDDGLNKFDGYSFKTYRNITDDSTSIPGSFVFCLYCDKRGRLWAGTQKGLCYYDYASDCFHQILNNTAIFFTTESENGDMVCGIAGGIDVIDHDDLSAVQHLSVGRTDQIKVLRENVILVKYDTRLSLFNFRDSLETDNLLLTGQESFLRFTSDKNDRIFALSTKRIYVLNVRDSISILDTIPLPSSPSKTSGPITLFCDQKEVLWLSMSSGLYTWDRMLKKFVPSHIIVDRIQAEKLLIEVMYEDSFGDIWLGDYGNGILLKPFNKYTFRSFGYNPYNENSISHDMVSAFAEDKQGLIWIGTWGGGLNYYDPKTELVKRYHFDDEQLNSAIFRGICFDKDGLLWLATNNSGLVKLNIKTGSYKVYQHNPSRTGSLPNNTLYSVFSLDDGEILVGQGSGDGLVHYRREDNSFESFATDTVNGLHIPVGYVRTLVEDHDHNLWFGTYGAGVNYVNLKSHKHFQFTSSTNPYGNSYLNNDVIYAIHQDSRGMIWIGTMGGGLNFLNPVTHQIRHINEKDGLSNDVVNGILEDSHDNLWISTNNGISRFTVPDCIYSDTLASDFPDDFDLHPYFINYDMNDGLQNNEFKYGAYLKSSTGEMYFGGISGFNVFHPDSIKVNRQVPRIILRDFTLFRRPKSDNEDESLYNGFIDDQKRINLRYNQNYFTIDWVGLNYNNPQKNSYRYMLEGFENQWGGSLNDLSATYMNLKPGTYTFRLQAANNDGIWTKESRDLVIYIKPPFWSRIGFQLAAIISLLGILFSFYRYRLSMLKQQSAKLENRVERRTAQLRQANEELEKSKTEIEEMAKKIHEADQSKLRFFTNISHEFRSPLTLIVGPVEKLLSDQHIDKGIRKQLAMVYRNALRLLKLINELLEFRKLESGNVRLQVTERDIVKFVKGIGSLFTFHAGQRKIEFKINAVQEKVFIWFDFNLMEKVIYNLLSNAFKYTEDRVEIRISLSSEENGDANWLKIVVSNNGKGISPEQQEYIFDRFYQVKKSNKNKSQFGSGIGLALCKEYLDLQHGRIFLEKSSDEGTSFVILVKTGKEHFSADQFAQDGEIKEDFDLNPMVDYEYHGDEKLLEDQEAGPDLPIVLVIDDNIDMLSYVGDILSDRYKLIFATNGHEGLERAYQDVPDLILCDIMMPEPDGLSITRQLKMDERTSHIPIILLSARATEEDRILGLENGADDYISKPFSSKFLQAQVNTVIENRVKIKMRYKDELGFNADNFVRHSPDDKFISKCMTVLEENLANENFRTEEFAVLMGMSRTQLYRKISAITDQSASEFIRTYRMRKAVELLKNGDHNISEVAFQVGFKSLSHFTRTFSGIFNESPTHFISRQK